jgi:valyl-tRNA synthetase
MASELPKTYDPKSVEHDVAAQWQAAGAFAADPQAPGQPYCIVIPPPNVTAALHLGHALNNTLQDVLIRLRRMQGRNALWMPGTDHAGIATQTVVEKRILAEEGKRRTDFARDEFVRRIQAWKDEYEGRILHQLQKMGCSCDWRRTRFTMDEVCARAVRAAFYKLFADGLIYRGKRLVNWDPATQTVLADDEVEHEDVKGFFYYLRYPLAEAPCSEGVSPARASCGEGVSPSCTAGVSPARASCSEGVSPSCTAGVSPARASCSEGVSPSCTAGVSPARASCSEGVPPSCTAGVSPARASCSEGVSPSCTAGVSPASDDASVFITFDREIDRRQGRSLPHWTQEGATYAVTFRLADSIPATVAAGWRQERDEILNRAARQNRDLTYVERVEINELFSARIESLLDAGQGECVLRNPAAAEIVQKALQHFHNQRYELLAWAIMPNHVHAVIQPIGQHQLADILHSWKSFTAKEINKALGRQGQLWMEEYYDHLIRDREDFVSQVNYVLDNPAKAGLKNWPWAGLRRRNEEERGQDARATRDNGEERGQDARDTRGQDALATRDNGEERGQDARDTRGQDALATSEETIRYVTVATTRPETMLGDTAVAMNPADPRAKHLVGKMVRLPIVGRLIPIVADEHVVLPNPDSDDEKARFSTGFLKVTPAHDPDDYAIGQRHDLPLINVMAPDGTISDKHGWTDVGPDAQFLLGMDRFEAREAIVEWFRTEGLLEDVRDYTHPVGHSYRSHVPIEPYLSDQWYVAVKRPIQNCSVPVAKWAADHPDLAETRDGVAYLRDTDVPVSSLAGLALMPLLDGRLTFTPDRYAVNYRTWLENLRDWPISRQLWWGHRIPVWSRELELPAGVEPLPTDRGPDAQACAALDAAVGGDWTKAFQGAGGYMLRVESHPEKHGWIRTFVCPQPGSEAIEARLERHGWKRDPDVLDTWFSSALWPFSTLGWPSDTPDTKTWYPGNVLCTAREIITLWVSRMVMMGQYCAGDIPFSQVFIHTMIQDGDGRKMSKSLGNGIDPLDIIDSHGSDAMRFTLVSMTTQTQDVRMPVQKMTLPDGRTANTSAKFDQGRNFCNKLWNASRFTMMNLAGMGSWQEIHPGGNLADAWMLSRLNATIRDATGAIDGFRFNELADTLYHFVWDDFCDWYLEIAKSRINAGDRTPKTILAYALDTILRLLHPVMPFITEAIWARLNDAAPFRGQTSGQAPKLLVRAGWPRADASRINPAAERDFAAVQDLIRQVRNIRTRHNVPPGKRVDLVVEAAGHAQQLLRDNVELIVSQAMAGSVTFGAGCSEGVPPSCNAGVSPAKDQDNGKTQGKMPSEDAGKMPALQETAAGCSEGVSPSCTAGVSPAKDQDNGKTQGKIPSEDAGKMPALQKGSPLDTAAVIVIGEIKVYVLGVVDRAAEKLRLTKQRDTLVKGIRGIEGKLANQGFLAKAPPELVEGERKRLSSLQAELASVEQSLSALG